MKFLRKKEAKSSTRSEELATRIAGNIIRLQTGVAHYLNNRTTHWSKRTKLSLLIMFCVLFAAGNLFLIIHSIHH